MLIGDYFILISLALSFFQPKPILAFMFQRNVVAYVEGQPRNIEKALVLKDAISDLPHVRFISTIYSICSSGLNLYIYKFVSFHNAKVLNDEDRENMPYESLPETDFQRYIRSTKHG